MWPLKVSHFKNMLFQTASTIEKISTRADNTISIHLSTQELTPEQATALFALKGQLGWCLFSPAPLNTSDIPTEAPPEFKGEKSPSKRLRDCLYVWWEKNTSRAKPFDEVWKEFCNKKCEEIKETLKD